MSNNQEYEVRVEYRVHVVSLFPPDMKEEVFMRGIESEFSMQAHANASGLENYFTEEIKKRREKLLGKPEGLGAG